MTPEEKQKLNELYEFMNNMKSSGSIPYEVDSAIKDRIRFSGLNPLASSTKSSTSEAQLVNESGSSSYNVLPLPDGYLQVTINSTTYYIPIFT